MLAAGGQSLRLPWLLDLGPVVGCGDCGLPISAPVRDAARSSWQETREVHRRGVAPIRGVEHFRTPDTAPRPPARYRPLEISYCILPRPTGRLPGKRTDSPTWRSNIPPVRPGKVFPAALSSSLRPANGQSWAYSSCGLHRTRNAGSIDVKLRLALPLLRVERTLAEMLSVSKSPDNELAHFVNYPAPPAAENITDFSRAAVLSWHRSTVMMANLTRVIGGGFMGILMPTPWIHASGLLPPHSSRSSCLLRERDSADHRGNATRKRRHASNGGQHGRCIKYF